MIQHVAAGLHSKTNTEGNVCLEHTDHTNFWAPGRYGMVCIRMDSIVL